MSHSTTNIDVAHKHGSYHPKEHTTNKVKNYFAPGPKRNARLKLMSACLFKFGLRSASGGPPNPLAYTVGSNNQGARSHMIECAEQNGDPM
jgi:hypothetical protein